LEPDELCGDFEAYRSKRIIENLAILGKHHLPKFPFAINPCTARRMREFVRYGWPL
jgi:hypothetical protein